MQSFVDRTKHRTATQLAAAEFLPAHPPQTEHAARPQLRGQPLETLGLVEGGIPRMEQKVRRMIDVDQYGVEAAARRVRVEARAGFR